MGRNGNYPTTIDDLREFDISFLSKNNYLKLNHKKVGGIIWTGANGNKNDIRITTDIKETKGTIILSYTVNKTENIDYTIRLITRPSNLGTGLLWFFLCPFTGKVCRKLHLINSYFKHRSALSGAMYQSQIEAKKWRNWIGVFNNEKLYSELYSKGFKRFYNGKITKRYARIKNKIDKSESIDMQDFYKMF